MSLYLLDSTVLIAHLRGNASVAHFLDRLLSEGHSVGTTCVNVAEIERGIRPAERYNASLLLSLRHSNIDY